VKKLFKALAVYNKSVNQSIIELLEPLKREQVMMETKAYFPSIFETFLHNFIADLSWLKNNKDAFREIEALSNSKLIFLEEELLRKEFESDYTKLFLYRRELDDLISQFIHELDEDKLNLVFLYKNATGQDVGKELWKTLLHWFNHQTHHRGQLSVLLDMIGVDHDYSSMVMRI
jgi:uncharacterized damage-inducible protein DinB